MAVPVREREEARRLLELVPDEDVPVMRRMLAGLAREEAPWEQVVAAFDNAPEDDEGELTDPLT